MLTQLGGVRAGAEEREKTEPLLYFVSHGCSGPTRAWPRKVWLWPAGDSAQDFPVEKAGLRERIASAAGEKFFRVSMPSITAFSQIPSQLLVQLGDHLTLQSPFSSSPASCHLSASQKLFQARVTSARDQILAIPPQRHPWPLEGLQGCPHPHGDRSSRGSLGTAVCVVLLSIPLKPPHSSAPRGGFVTLPPPSPQLVPLPGSSFPHHTREHRCGCLLLLELDPGFPLSELLRTVILGVVLELAGFTSFLGGETSSWSQGEVKGPYSFPPRNRGGWKRRGVFGTCCSFWEAQKGMKGRICGVMLL